jgi:hypothetical protein
MKSFEDVIDTANVVLKKDYDNGSISMQMKQTGKLGNNKIVCIHMLMY